MDSQPDQFSLTVEISYLHTLKSFLIGAFRSIPIVFMLFSTITMLLFILVGKEAIVKAAIILCFLIFVLLGTTFQLFLRARKSGEKTYRVTFDANSLRYKTRGEEYIFKKDSMQQLIFAKKHLLVDRKTDKSVIYFKPEEKEALLSFLIQHDYPVKRNPSLHSG